MTDGDADQPGGGPRTRSAGRRAAALPINLIILQHLTVLGGGESEIYQNTGEAGR